MCGYFRVLYTLINKVCYMSLYLPVMLHGARVYLGFSFGYTWHPDVLASREMNGMHCVWRAASRHVIHLAALCANVPDI